MYWLLSQKCTVLTGVLQWSTFIDAYFKGYDVVYVEDIAATTSPYYATQIVVYSICLLGIANRRVGDGFLTNSTAILPALKQLYKG